MLRMRLKKLYVRVFGCPKTNTSIVYKKNQNFIAG